jgi:hypothetical protein
MRAACHVGKDLVYGDPLDEGREITDHLGGWLRTGSLVRICPARLTASIAMMYGDRPTGTHTAYPPGGPGGNGLAAVRYIASLLGRDFN